MLRNALLQGENHPHPDGQKNGETSRVPAPVESVHVPPDNKSDEEDLEDRFPSLLQPD